MKTILIVDDEKNIRLTLKQSLNNGEYEISTVVNGEEALETLLKKSFDVVIMDIKMPGLTGIEVLKKLKENNVKITVIIMTAYGTVDNAVEAMKLGAVDFISKPFSPDEIRKAVEQCVNRNYLVEENLNTSVDYIQFAKKCIKDFDLKKAEDHLCKAIAADVDSAEAHNLYGILCENQNEVQRASKHYRVAYTLDPSYLPAKNNLMRVGDYKYTKSGMDYGDEKQGEN